MARGWESKSIESQQEDAIAARKRAGVEAEKNAAEVVVERKRSGLMLDRTRVLHDLQTACNPRYRAMLELALTDLDQRIAQLG